ncbi:MAG: Flagellar hook-length control protein FliK [Labilithrix sp.]|nr:Flagellar hook-length control protein FliK [Labilithrix sp.]
MPPLLPLAAPMPAAPLVPFVPLALLCAAVLASACGSSASAPGSATGDTSPANPPADVAGAAPVTPAPAAPTAAPPVGTTTKTGVLLFATAAPIAGVAFESGAQKGTTDAKGTFTYDDGKPVRFSIGSVLLGTAPGAAIISPYQVAGAATCEDTAALTTLVGLLESLDADANASNGITVPASSTGASSGATPDPQLALRTFITAFDSESWTTGTMDTFSYVDAVVRGQGVATDGTSWFFSGNTGLEKTSGAFVSTTKNLLAIPLLLAAQGSNHIGDIDIWNGKIYAPVEDKTYAAPKVVLYDPASLNSGTVYDIPQNLQTKGVPWIAVDGPRGLAYLAEWDPTPAVNVFSLATMTFLRAIPLSTPTGRVQGGKVWKGQLYFSTDDAQKTVLKVHLASGTIFPLFALNADVEMEGLAFFPRPDGSLLHTLDVTTARTGVELRHHTITKEPLRWKVCP